ncbi:MAG: Y-family DNA polymerase [Halothiobacillaceae bacterium]
MNVSGREYWLALRFGALALEALETPGDAAPALVLAGAGAHARVWSANRVAMDLGITPGMSWSAARARIDEETNWRILTRDPQAESERLEQLALWAGQFSSRIVKHEDPPGLLLELGGGQALFGSVDRQTERLLAGLRDQGTSCRHAGAPVAAAAWALAGLGVPACYGPRDWLAAVCRLPVEALERAPPRTLAALRSVGIETLAACLRQPRAELAARHGRVLLQALDELTGKQARPVDYHVPPSRFVQRQALEWPTASVDGLLMATRRLLVALEGYLRGRQAEICRLQWCLEHEDHPETVVAVGWRQGQRRADALLEALRLQGERLALPAPVEAVVIRAEQIEPLALASGDLFDSGAGLAEGLDGLLDRLGARLGVRAVCRVHATSDPRPGPDTMLVDVSTPWSAPEVSLPTRAPRPLWLCEDRLALQPPVGHPLADEFIETGWWSDQARPGLYRRGLGAGHALLWFHRPLAREGREQASGWQVVGCFG